MKPEQQKIAIAEACGWTECVFVESIGLAKGRPGNNKPSYGTYENGMAQLPDYLNDLNAMHQAEQTLWEKDWTSRHDFIDKLARIINPTHGHHQQSAIDLLDATAAERAEAFIRTIGKWKTKTN
jgi:hypothetical protein